MKVLHFVLVSAVCGVIAQTTAVAETTSVACPPGFSGPECLPSPVDPVPTTGALDTNSTIAPGETATPDHDHEDGEEDHDHEDGEHEDHTDAAGTGSLAPSPTESVGCEPHGDHWHCDGPAVTKSAGSTASPTGEEDVNATEVPGGAASVGVGLGLAAVVGVVGVLVV